MKALNLILSLALLIGVSALGDETAVTATPPAPVSLDSELQKLH